MKFFINKLLNSVCVFVKGYVGIFQIDNDLDCVCQKCSTNEGTNIKQLSTIVFLKPCPVKTEIR